ncbi:hypothetical protein EW146_g7355 [Bondarzewia mesenterica]|uniref:Homeobox domain-containing protein n=1 Tax=Bondarzewia mesenterica TaxID=1095465 RepID=A0A4V3XE93_9AGAM|nr:hypothetical protein EW146_g7355 [Bondarzewia mesenterica]
MSPNRRRSHSHCSSTATTTSAAIDDTTSSFEDESTQVPYARDVLHLRNFALSRNHSDYKSVTVWFQNRRQSDKRKAWTKNARAKARADADAKRPNGHSPKKSLSTSKPPITLDRIASLYELPFHPTIHEFTSVHQPPLTPRRSHHYPQLQVLTPVSRNDLWRHMPSTPPETQSSPSADTLRFSMIHSPSKPMKSLEWACAKARVDRRQGKGKENRLPTIVRIMPLRSGKVVKTESMMTMDLKTEEGESDSEAEFDEAITPGASMSSIRSSLFAEDLRSDFPKMKKPSLKKRETNISDDMEAAMVLLGFRK